MFSRSHETHFSITGRTPDARLQSGFPTKRYEVTWKCLHIVTRLFRRYFGPLYHVCLAKLVFAPRV
jgi:hypothetical protein